MGRNRIKKFCLIGMVFAGVLGLAAWTKSVEHDAHWKPDYEKEDIGTLLDKASLSEEEYMLLFYQTGLSKSAIDTLYMEGREKELLKLQELFFAEVEMRCEFNTVISKAEYLVEDGKAVKGQDIPVVEDGDILINFNCHVFGWRSGHAAIVTDAQAEQTLEARILGMDSTHLNIDYWEVYPSFAVLRLKNASAEERHAIAGYAEEYLTGVPYHLTAGMSQVHGKEKEAAGMQKKKSDTSPSGTQCAHLVWYVYNQFGYDLDSDGGRIVTPRDLYDSKLLEIVQIYGLNPLKTAENINDL